MSRRLATVGVFLAVLLLGAVPARADFMVGIGTSGNVGFQNAQVRLPDSWSLDGALGYRLTLGVVELTPELDLTYQKSTGNLTGRAVDWGFQAAAGARLGLSLSMVVPSVYVLVGLGMLETTSQELVRHSSTGPYYEVGGAVDFRLGESVSLGVQAGFGSISLANAVDELRNAKVNKIRAGVRLTFFL